MMVILYAATAAILIISFLAFLGAEYALLWMEKNGDPLADEESLFEASEQMP